MAKRYEKTKYPGIYKRGTRYAVKQRDGAGRMITHSAGNVAEARAIQTKLRADRLEGREVARPQTFATYADEWLYSYAGRTGRGFRAATREGYRQMINKHAKPFFGSMQLRQIQPRDIKAFSASLTRKGLAPASVRRYLSPVKAMLATAWEDGVIPINPAANVRTSVPRDQVALDERAKALSEDELEALLDTIDPDWRPFTEFLALTGMRIGEAVAVQWEDVDFVRGAVRVRRAAYQGVIDKPKTKYGIRTIPLTPKLTRILKLRKREAGNVDDATPIFTNSEGTMLDPQNYRKRIMRPAAAEAGIPWATPHILRHTFASRCFRHGCNLKQVQALLGHHSPAFTLETYVHLLPEDLPDLGFLD